MSSLFSLQSCISEKHLRCSFQPIPPEQIESVASRRFIVMLRNGVWTIHSFLFQVCLAVESAIKLSFSLLAMNHRAIKNNAIRLLSTPVNFLITSASLLLLPAAPLAPETLLNLHQSTIGLTQITSSFFHIKNLETADLCCSTGSTSHPEMTEDSSAKALLSLISDFPNAEDLYLLARAVNQYWQNIPHLLKFTCELNEHSYKTLEMSLKKYISSEKTDSFPPIFA